MRLTLPFYYCSCTGDEFMCTDGNCVSVSFRCDGDPDCLDASDEADCRKYLYFSRLSVSNRFMRCAKIHFTETPIPDCPEGEFKCKGSMSSVGGPGNRCILLRFRCDGDNDCGDWSDEEGCENMKSSSCTSSEFRCDDGTCIPNKWKCDMEQDCDGGEDEKSCTDQEKAAKRTCAADEHQCKDGRCILVMILCEISLLIWSLRPTHRRWS